MLGAAAVYSLTSVMGKAAMHYVPPLFFGPFYFLVLGLATPLALGLDGRNGCGHWADGHWRTC
jgi:hypothetical protein